MSKQILVQISSDQYNKLTTNKLSQSILSTADMMKNFFLRDAKNLSAITTYNQEDFTKVVTVLAKSNANKKVLWDTVVEQSDLLNILVRE